METQVRTPQAVFMQPQRLVVPLFQRAYVWNEDEQWDPLWDDVVRVADPGRVAICGEPPAAGTAAIVTGGWGCTDVEVVVVGGTRGGAAPPPKSRASEASSVCSMTI